MASAATAAAVVAHRYALWTRLGEDGAAAFDAEGRLLTWRRGDGYWRRGLDNRLVRLRRDPDGPTPWASERRGGLDRHCRDIGLDLERLRPPAGDARAAALLDRARAGLADGYRDDAARFAAAVGPVPIVPPNHARSVVLRLTEGCRYNRCRFCSLYLEQGFRVRPEGEWREHVRAVLAYFGEGAGMRPELWLGDASLLEAGAERAIAALDVLRREVRLEARPAPGRLDKGVDPFRFDGVNAFADVPGAARLEARAAAELAARGVRRLYLGVESGHEPLLRRLRKPHRPDEVREAVRRLRCAGLGVGLILLVGAGGRGMVDAHRRDSRELVASLELGGDDFLFLSPLDAEARASGVAGDEPLTARELAAEVGRMRSELGRATGRRLRIADYQLDRFVY